MNFVHCSKKSTTGRYANTNNPVNMSNVATFSAGKENYYPDNQGVPSIIFTIDGNLTVKWVYERYDVKLRDSDYEYICRKVNE